MVAFALWQRSRTTEHVREFWGASQANLIQHGSTVKLRVAQHEWQDISTAPGLVHLRATLVDDRYYQWDRLELVSSKSLDSHYVLQFEQADRRIELAIQPDSGLVINLQSQQAVPLISASRQAVAAYLKEIHANGQKIE